MERLGVVKKGTTGFLKRKAIKFSPGNESIAYVLISPYYIFFAIFIIIPILANLYFSFTNYDLYRTMNFIGMQNYVNLFKDDVFLISLKNTFVYAGFNVIPLITFGFIIAVLVNMGTGVLKAQRVFFFIPYITSMVAVSMVWLIIYDPTSGILNKVITAFGFGAKDWLYDIDLALPCLIAVNLWKNLGYIMIIYLAGLQNIPEELYEAATIDGANALQKLKNVTIPLIAPVSFFLFVTTCIESFKVFEQVNIMTMGGPVNSTTTIVHQIYIKAFTEYKMGYASAISIVLLLIVAMITLANFKMGNQGQDVELG